MYALDTTEETAAVVGLCRALALDVLDPAATSSERSGSVSSSVRNALFETGLTTPVATEFGGGGVPTSATQTAAIDALAYGDAGLTMAAVWSGAAASCIGTLGTDAQRQAHLPRFASDANAHGAIALYEGHGRSPSESATTITKNPAGGWAIKGTKLAVAGAASANPLLVVGVDPADGSLRIALVSPSAPGVTAAPVDRQLALDAAHLSSVNFDCTVSDDALLGGENTEQSAIHLALSNVRILLASAMLGTSERAMDYAAKYSTERMAFGKPIAAFQGVSFMLADIAIRVAAARLDVADIAARIDNGAVENLEAATTAAVNYVGAVASQSTRDALQVLGGHGFINDHPVERFYRSAAAMSALDFDPLCTAFETAL
jgi:alkylation response protein AidB-like acyl-CoA dehydrogenase